MTRGRAGALALLAVVVLAAAWPPAASAQCAMCRTALTGSPEGRGIAAQFNIAIVMMIAAPYLVAGVVAGVLFRRQLSPRLWRLVRMLPLPRRLSRAR
jgi:hypothetical protein